MITIRIRRGRKGRVSSWVLLCTGCSQQIEPKRGTWTKKAAEKAAGMHAKFDHPGMSVQVRVPARG